MLAFGVRCVLTLAIVVCVSVAHALFRFSTPFISLLGVRLSRRIYLFEWGAIQFLAFIHSEVLLHQRYFYCRRLGRVGRARTVRSTRTTVTGGWCLPMKVRHRSVAVQRHHHPRAVLLAVAAVLLWAKTALAACGGDSDDPICLDDNSPAVLTEGSAYQICVGGGSNAAVATASSILGGGWNTVLSVFGSIGGGQWNSVAPDSESATISGGTWNTVLGNSAAVAGGAYNKAVLSYAFIGGGLDNQASG